MKTLKFARRNRNSNSNIKKESTAMIARAIRIAFVALFALTAALSTFGTAAAATPATPTIPAGLKAIGPVLEWKSKTVENNRPGPLANTFELPSATTLISATFIWRGTNNDGPGNENGIVRTSAPAPNDVFTCADQGHGPHVCATFVVSYTSHRFDVSVEYDLTKKIATQHGDSHHYTILVQPYGPRTNDVPPPDGDNDKPGNTPDRTTGHNTPGTDNGNNTPDTSGNTPETYTLWNVPETNLAGDAPTVEVKSTPSFGMFVSYTQTGYGMLLAIAAIILALFVGLVLAHLARYREHIMVRVANILG